MGTFPSIWPAISRIGYCSSGNLAIKEFTLGILVNLPILVNIVNFVVLVKLAQRRPSHNAVSKKYVQSKKGCLTMFLTDI